MLHIIHVMYYIGKCIKNLKWNMTNYHQEGDGSGGYRSRDGGSHYWIFFPADIWSVLIIYNENACSYFLYDFLQTEK